jgi:hypothetical protein
MVLIAESRPSRELLPPARPPGGHYAEDFYVVSLPRRLWRRILIVVTAAGFLAIALSVLLTCALVFNRAFRDDAFEFAMALRVPVSTRVLKTELDGCHADLRVERRARNRCTGNLGALDALNTHCQTQLNRAETSLRTLSARACSPGAGLVPGKSGR